LEWQLPISFLALQKFSNDDAPLLVQLHDELDECDAHDVADVLDELQGTLI
jgi:hypothetical protein